MSRDVSLEGELVRLSRLRLSGFGGATIFGLSGSDWPFGLERSSVWLRAVVIGLGSASRGELKLVER